MARGATSAVAAAAGSGPRCAARELQDVKRERGVRGPNSQLLALGWKLSHPPPPPRAVRPQWGPQAPRHTNPPSSRYNTQHPEQKPEVLSRKFQNQSTSWSTTHQKKTDRFGFTLGVTFTIPLTRRFIRINDAKVRNGKLEVLRFGCVTVPLPHHMDSLELIYASNFSLRKGRLSLSPSVISVDPILQCSIFAVTLGVG